MRTISLGLSALFVLVGCVSQGRYDAALSDGLKARNALGACASERDAQARRYQDELDDEMAVAGRLGNELEKKGSDLTTLLGERGELARAVAEERARLEQLRRAQAAEEARNALYRDLARKLQSMIDAGSVRVGLRDGRMVIQLSNDVLFDSGQVVLKPAGKEALTQIGAVLKQVSGRRFQIAGHTDDVPVHTARFASNWELSTERAIEVVRYMIGQGVATSSLSAAGYGEFDPVAPNNLSQGRARNRRIEITLEPRIDELVAVPE